jgi:hypothetical protein
MRAADRGIEAARGPEAVAPGIEAARAPEAVAR